MFQPVVSLPDERVIGYEALARWPMFDTATPQNVFSFANASRRADVLDQHASTLPSGPELEAAMPRGRLLLVNTEPTVGARPQGPPACVERRV